VTCNAAKRDNDPHPVYPLQWSATINPPRDDGLYQIWNDNILEGLGEEYDDEPVAGLFGTLAEAQKEFLRSNPGFEVELSTI
jgi:hypothetical protein